MCGILGTIPAIPLPYFSEALSLLKHRGPDGSYTWHDETHTISLGHTRLAIIDKSASGIQPMHKEHLHIVYNGEIFNFVELREELISLGFSFTSTSDTEVILNAYKAWKEECFTRFNGMWALAIWNDIDNTLLLSRDRFGEKPLYYINHNNCFAFASEMKALIPFLEKVEVHTNFKSFCDNPFAYEATEDCLIKDIKRFPASHWGTYKKGELVLQQYWNTKEHLQHVSSNYKTQTEEFRSLFLDAVKIRMRSDVPIGTALSGGIDSSCVAVAMHAIAGKVESNFNHNWQNVFSAVYPNSDLDESVYIKSVTAQLNIKAFEVEIDATKALEDFEDDYYKFEELYITSPFPMLQTYAAMREQGVVVTLDGHGADELFCGYDTFMLAALKDCGLNPFAIQSILNTYNALGGDKSQFQKKQKTFSEYIKWNTGSENISALLPIAKEEIRKAFASPKIQKEKMDTLTENLYKLFHTDNLPTLLRNYDHYSMANGVEVRSPFLDHRLVSYTFSLPWQSKLSKGFTKTILRDAMQPYLPKAIYHRKSKMGFQTPIVDWLKGPWKNYFLDLINSERFHQSSFIEPNTVRKNIENCINNKHTSYREGELAYTSIAPFLWEVFVFEKFKQIHLQFKSTKTEF